MVLVVVVIVVVVVVVTYSELYTFLDMIRKMNVIVFITSIWGYLIHDGTGKMLFRRFSLSTID